ncbi:MAG: hypothetical protein AAGU15_02695 [Anaerolineaceae bacterium]|jgi:hypothetical protein
MQNERNQNLYLNRFSILLAFLALGFALVYLLPTENDTATGNILGIQFELSFYNFIPFLLAMLTVVGTVWVFSVHPIWKRERLSFFRLIPHLMLPFIATLILAIVLRQSARSPIWWVVFLTGYTIITLLLRAEYVLIEGAGINSLGYSVLVISAAFGLFLLLTIALKNSNVRMIAQFLLIFFSALFVSFRLLSLQEGNKDPILKALLASMMVVQLSVALHYVFIPPVQYGLLLTGLLYSLSSWLSQFNPEKKWHQYLEPILMSLITIAMVVVSLFV